MRERCEKGDMGEGGRGKWGEGEMGEGRKGKWGEGGRRNWGRGEGEMEEGRGEGERKWGRTARRDAARTLSYSSSGAEF